MRVVVDFNKFKEEMKVMDKFKKKHFNNLFLIAEGSKLILRKENNNIQLNVTLNADVSEEGYVITSDSTNKILKNIKSDDFLSIDGHEIKINKKVIKFNETDKEELKNYDDINIECFKVSEKELLRLLSCKYCLNNSSSLPYLNGLNLLNNQFCALDGYRLSVRTSEEFTSDLNVIIPSDAVELMCKLLNKKSNDKVSVYINSNKKFIKFKYSNIELVGKLIDTNFPIWKSIIREKENNRVILKVEDKNLKDSINLINKSISNSVMILNINNDKVFFECSDDENKISDVINCNKEGNKEIKMGIDHKYFFDAIKQYDDKFDIYINGKNDNIIITNNYEDIDLICPMRLKE